MPDDRNHARQMQTPTSETRRWDLTSNLTRRPYLITSDHNILNLDDESRNDHRSHRARRIVVLVTQLSHEKQRTRNQPKSVRQSVLDARHAFSSSLRNQRDRRKSCSTRQRRNSDSDGSEWITRTMVGLCDGMLLLLATRARQEGRWQDSMREKHVV